MARPGIAAKNTEKIHPGPKFWNPKKIPKYRKISKKILCFGGRYVCQRTLVIRIAVITLASDSAITIARFRPLRVVFFYSFPIETLKRQIWQFSVSKVICLRGESCLQNATLTFQKAPVLKPLFVSIFLIQTDLCFLVLRLLCIRHCHQAPPGTCKQNQALSGKIRQFQVFSDRIRGMICLICHDFA